MTDPQHHARLIARVAEARDKTAFAELFDHFAPRIKAYLIRLGAEPGAAEDIVQDAMVTLWRKAHMFDARRASAATWLFRIARNRRIDTLRRDRSDRLDPEEPMLRPPAPEAQDDSLDARIRDDRVRHALKDLPPDQVELIRQAFYSGLSHSQIAEESGIPLGTVKSRIRLAFTKLRKTLEADSAVDRP